MGNLCVVRLPLRAEYQQLLDDQVAQARDELGSLGIYLEVTYAEGTVEGRQITSGAVESALNYALTDSNGVRSKLFSAGAAMHAGKAVMIANLWNRRTVTGTLAHEIAHHLNGDTQYQANDFLNAIFDTGHAAVRSQLEGRPAFSRMRALTPYLPGVKRVREHSWRRMALRLFGQP